MVSDKFKQRAFDRSSEKGEQSTYHSVTADDLVALDRCSLCGSEAVSVLAEVYLPDGTKFFATSSCQTCLHTYRSVSPSLDWFKGCWTRISTNKLEVFNPAVEEIRKGRYEFYYDRLSKYVQSGRMLDVGASYGSGANVFKEQGFEIEAIEPEDDRANYLENYHGIPVVAPSIEEFVGSPKPYELIIMAHCLEHLDGPRYVASRLKEVLNPDSGVLYVEVPNIWNSVTWADAFYLAHKNNFSESNLVRLFEESGFRVVDRIYPWNEGEQRWDIGLILQSGNSGTTNAEDTNQPARESTLNDVRRLYRLEFPLSSTPALDSVLKYEVPGIEHFYYTLRLDDKRVVEPETVDGLIGFEAL